ncbi:hypothetical protein FRC02_011348 [Tulasnella sp. 418]|nr:hypothetical protein FRC02_011348 [Tulasnella sp. 418]
MEMMYRYQSSKDPLTLNKCKEEWREHLQTPGYDYQELCFMSSDRYWAVTSSSRNTTMLYRRQTGEATYAGGIVETYSYKNDDYRILSSQTVLFMALSSYLAEFTKDPEFLKYAIPSATCIKANMLDSHTTLVSDWVIDAFTATFIEEGGVSCALTGICIEGLSILASVTGDDTWRSLALSMAESAMQSKAWHGRNGVLSIGSDSISFESDVIKSHKGLLNRGLLVAYQRNPSNIHFRDLVRSYINVQYNALLDLSSDGDSYGVNWAGPYTGPYSHGQLAALDTLIAAIGVNE